MFGRVKGISWSQEKIVFLIAIALFGVFSVSLNGFLSPGNLVTLVRSVSTLGILGVGMAVLVIGGGIDLAIVSIYAMSAAWTFSTLPTAARPCRSRGLLLAICLLSWPAC